MWVKKVQIQLHEDFSNYSLQFQVNELCTLLQTHENKTLEVDQS